VVVGVCCKPEMADSTIIAAETCTQRPNHSVTLLYTFWFINLLDSGPLTVSLIRVSHVEQELPILLGVPAF